NLFREPPSRREVAVSRALSLAGIGGPVFSQPEAMSQIRHQKDWGHEQHRSDENPEEDGQFGEGTEGPDDRDRLMHQPTLICVARAMADAPNPMLRCPIPARQGLASGSIALDWPCGYAPSTSCCGFAEIRCVPGTRASRPGDRQPFDGKISHSESNR